MRLFLKLIFFLSLLIFPKLYAQIPAWQMPHDSSSRWHTIIATNLGPGNPGPTLRYERYVVGDSVYGNKTYSIIHQSYSQTPWGFPNPTVFNCDHFCALMRSDSGRVYLKTFNDTAERLIFDFNLQLGQTYLRLVTYPSGTYTVHKIDTVTVNGQQRRKFSDTLWNVSMIEGVGDSHFGFWGPEGFSCYQEGDSLYSNNIPIPPSNCGIGFSGCTPLSVSNINPHTISIFPNPASSFIQINNSYMLETGSLLTVYDMNGRIAGTWILSDNTSRSIDITALSPGIYMLRLNNSMQKLIVQPAQ